LKTLAPRTIQYVFVDRDGVLNRKMPEDVYVSDWRQFEWLPGAEEAVARMNRARLTVILVTNQRGVALGLVTEEQIQEIHARMQSHLALHRARLDAIYYCPHDRGQCRCRKPDIGLFEAAFARFTEANSDNSIVIGDSISDIQAGRRLGMRTIFLRGEAMRQKAGADTAAEMADAVASSLLEAVELHLGLGGQS
jgi:D-glycero-D-manno-heptose 1,7-bisphosphate phosphatase